MMSPAKKAPKAKDSPASEVRKATAKQMVIVVIRKSSLLLVLATRNMSFGTRYRALMMVMATTMTVLSNNISTLLVTFPACPAIMGVKSIMGTTMMSWKMSMASALRPWGADISLRSCNTFSTIAVLDKEKRKPTNR